MNEDIYSIVFAQLRFVCGVFGHNFLVLMDARGRVLRELNGLATGANGKMKPVGYLPSDTLRVYEDERRRYFHAGLPQTVVARGGFDEIMLKWSAMQACAAALNAKCMRYPCLGLGRNSNSVASTLLAALGVEEPRLARSAWFAPGIGRLLLNESVLSALGKEAASPIYDDAPERVHKPRA